MCYQPLSPKTRPVCDQRPWPNEGADLRTASNRHHLLSSRFKRQWCDKLRAFDEEAGSNNVINNHCFMRGPVQATAMA